MREEAQTKMQMQASVEVGPPSTNSGPAKSIPTCVKAGDDDTFSDGSVPSFVNMGRCVDVEKTRHFPGTLLTSRRPLGSQISCCRTARVLSCPA